LGFDGRDFDVKLDDVLIFDVDEKDGRDLFY